MHWRFQMLLNSLILHFLYDIARVRLLHLHIGSLISLKEEVLIQIKMYPLHLKSMFLLIFHFLVKVQNSQLCCQQL
jgi:hypothetical protein